MYCLRPPAACKRLRLLPLQYYCRRRVGFRIGYNIVIIMYVVNCI